MAVYIITGRLGSGKTLVCVGKIRDYLLKGRPVATNLDVDLPVMFNPWFKRGNLMRVPDHPSREDLDAIGNGSDSPDESTFGALVLDECGTWFNSRSWADKTRQAVIDWLLHARKRGWDVFLIIQSLSMLDKQAREALAEFSVVCRRTDRFKFAGIHLPKVHLGFVRYGTLPTDAVVERWVYRGRELYRAYDTRQVFRPRGFPGAVEAVHSVLMPGQFSGPAPSRLFLVVRALSPSLVELLGQIGRRVAQLRAADRGARSSVERPRPAHIVALMRLPPDRRVRLMRELELAQP